METLISSEDCIRIGRLRIAGWISLHVLGKRRRLHKWFLQLKHCQDFNGSRDERMVPDIGSGTNFPSQLNLRY
ncbi:hypothetical protein Hdeb2414_s0001g00004121 [Helianthus debilis subsp. tardiflorus]